MSDDGGRIATGNPVAERLTELANRLADSINLARLMPGQRINLTQLALHLRAKADDVSAILPDFVDKALVSLNGTEVVIAPLDRGRLMTQMEKREPLEKAIAKAAASKANPIQREAIMNVVQLMKRAAMVGDMEGYMNADRVMERHIGDAAQLPDSFDQLVAIKREFRRAWCAHNRLRDLNVPAALRFQLAASITKGDQDAAVDAVHHFLDYLRQAY